MANIFIDLGANKGQSVRDFRLGTTPNGDRIDFNNWRVYCFEPNPKLFPKLEAALEEERRQSPLGTFEFIPAGAGTVDGAFPFFEGIRSDASGTFSANRRKRAAPCHRWPNGSGPVLAEVGIDLPVIDFPKWLRENITDDDYIVLKCDIEGAEHDLMRALTEKGLVQRIAQFYCEWHTASMVPPISRREVNLFIKRLRELGVEVLPWR